MEGDEDTEKPKHLRKISSNTANFQGTNEAMQIPIQSEQGQENLTENGDLRGQISGRTQNDLMQIGKTSVELLQYQVEKNFLEQKALVDDKSELQMFQAGKIQENLNTIKDQIEHSKYHAATNYVKTRDQLGRIEKKMEISKMEKLFTFGVPLPSPAFAGRESVLKELHEKLKRGRDECVLQVTSITGLGGVGKSELVKKYIATYRKDHYESVLWFQADNYSTLFEGFKNLAKKIRIETDERSMEDIRNDIYDSFSEQNCLFVFDNASYLTTEQEDDDGLDKFLPKNQTTNDNLPCVIITSRFQNWDLEEDGISESLPLDVLETDEAVQVLRNIIEGKSTTNKHQNKEEDFVQLAELLGCLPLALTQAAAYIKAANAKRVKPKDFLIKDYITRYEEEVEQRREFYKNKGLRNETVYTTWKITMNRIKEEDTNAEELLFMISFFSPNKISIKELLFGFKKSTHNNSSDEKDQVTGSKTTQNEIEAAVNCLYGYSLINLDESNENISIHRLVQEVNLQFLRDNKRIEECLNLFLPVFYGAMKRANFTHFQSMWTHVLECDKNIRVKLLQRFCAQVPTFQAHLFEYHHWREMASIGQLVKPYFIEDFGEAYVVAIEYLTSLAFLMLGSFEEAEKISEESIAIILRIFPGLWKTSNQIEDELLKVFFFIFFLHNSIRAVAIFNLKRRTEGLELMNEILSKSKQAFGESHPYTLLFMSEAANLFHMNGNYNEATELRKILLEKKEEIFESDHPATIEAMKDLAISFGKISDYTQAVKMNTEFFEKYKEYLRHQNIILDPTDLDNSRHTQAIKLNELLFERKRESLGPDHPDTLSAMKTLATCLFMTGDLTKGAELLVEVLEKKKEILGLDHPETIAVMQDLAWLLPQSTSFKELDEWLETLNAFLDIFDNNIGLLNKFIAFLLGTSDYTKFIEVYMEFSQKLCGNLESNQGNIDTFMDNLVISLGGPDDFHKAIKLIEEVFKEIIEILGLDYSYTTTVLVNLAISIFETKDGTKAEKLLEEFLEKIKKNLGLDHSVSLITIISNVAVPLGKTSCYTKVVKMLEGLFEKCKGNLGLDHPDTVSDMNTLARSLVTSFFGTDDNTKAVRFIEKTLNIVINEFILKKLDPTTGMQIRAISLRKRGEYVEAAKLFEEILEKRKETLGLDHPDTIAAMVNLAGCLLNRGENMEAAKLLEEAIKKTKEILMLDHPNTTGFINNPSTCPIRREELFKLVALGAETYETFCSIFGYDAPGNYLTMNNFANFFIP